MSLLVHPENQQLIWNIINNNPFVIQFFQSNSHMNKENWFKSTMEHFYNLHRDKNIDKLQLNQLNKEVLTHMIQTLHTSSSNQPVKQEPPIQSQPTSSQQSYNTIQTPPIPENNQAQIYQNQFNEKKQEYSSMFDVTKPDDIDFREKETDTVLTNADELLQQQIKERNAYLNIHPSPSVDVSHTTLPDTSVSENIQLVPSTNEPEQHVVNINSKVIDMLSEQQNEIKKLNDLLVSLSKEIQEIKSELSSATTKEQLNQSTTNFDFMNEDVLVETVESDQE